MPTAISISTSRAISLSIRTTLCARTESQLHVEGPRRPCGPRGFDAEGDRVYRNRGDGTFEDATSTWGFDRVAPQYGLGVLIRDFDGDGSADVFVANDSCANFLFVRRGNRFDDVALESGVAYSEDGRSMAGMGVDSTDLNGDGLPDLVVTNFSDQPNSVFLSTGKGRWPRVLATFRDVARVVADGRVGAAFADFDLDGDDDISSSPTGTCTRRPIFPEPTRLPVNANSS
jgi:hypothetical protein